MGWQWGLGYVFGFICGGGCMAQWIAYRRNMDIGERLEREARRGLERLAALDRSQEAK